uniref:Sulfatase N-terminal domain-containing protein n=2 Tax=Strongyloides stercoralis TaxID=6248 RepID=A0A0K0DVL8_STRER
MYSIINNDDKIVFNHIKQKLRNSISKDTKNCILPNLDPWDSSIKKYIFNIKNFKCKNIQGELTYIDEGKLMINKSELNNFGFKMNDLTFQYRCLSRGEDDFTLSFSNWKVFKNETKISCEFIEVKALKSYFKLNIYSNHHYQIISNEKNKIINSRKASVFIIVLDSLSHSNFIRKLPKTLSVLINDYQSIIFNGMTKVGDNSFPNAVAFLSGKRTMTSGYKDEINIDIKKDFFDSLPLIWNDFSKKNYTTLYAEDYTDYNLFTYLAKGFKNQPTTYYFRPLWLSIYKSWLIHRSTYLCYGNNKMHNIQLGYLEKFIQFFPQLTPLFSLTWFTEIGHDYINQIEIADEDFENFLKRNKEKLENSFLFILGDHGHRFDDIRKTSIGRMEERLPFFSLSIPKKLKQQRKDIVNIIKNNSNILTSFWDFYVTLKDITNMGDSNSFEYNKNSLKGIYSKRGESLLRPISEKRNCKNAGIPEEFCPCQREVSLVINDTKSKILSNVFIKYLNRLLYNSTNLCEKLKIKEIIGIEKFLPSIDINKSFFSKLLYSFQENFNIMTTEQAYRVTIQTSPGDGIFEGIFLSNSSTSYINYGSINRINKYGNTSYCVNNQVLRKICFCKSLT